MTAHPSFKQFLINEESVKTDSLVSKLSNQLKQIINQFLLPVSEDKQEFRKRMLLGREVIHVIEDAAKNAIENGEFNSNTFKTNAKNEVTRLLNPPASERNNRDKYPSVASAFNNKIVGFLASNINTDTINTVSSIGDKWNELSRITSKSTERGEEKQMSQKYERERKRSGSSSKGQTYKNVNMRAKKGSK